MEWVKSFFVGLAIVSAIGGLVFLGVHCMIALWVIAFVFFTTVLGALARHIREYW